jgi:Flp pilus assembly protein TadG
MIKSTRKFRSKKSEFAQTMVEFALVFPIILLITYGIIEFGRIVFIYTAVTSAAREGARYGAAAGTGVNGIEQYADCAGIRTAVRNGAFLVNIPDANITIDYIKASSPTYTCPQVASNVSLINLGYQVRVRVDGYYSPIIPFLGLSQNPVLIRRQNARTILMGVQIDQ